jgi:uncharacterized protein YjdB
MKAKLLSLCIIVFIVFKTSNIDAATISGSSSVCIGSSVTYTTEAGMSNYVWTVSAGGTKASGGGNTNTITITWNTAETQTVSVNYDGGTAFTKNITVNSLPVPIITGTSSVCIGSTITYTTESGMSNYVWNLSGGTKTAGGGSSDNTITITWNAVGAQATSVGYKSTNGCTSPSPTIHGVIVNALPSPTLTGTYSVCQNATLTYTTETGMNNYAWVINGGTKSSGGGINDNTVTITWSSSGTVSVNYKNPSGCAAPSPTEKTVTVNALPTPTLNGPSQAVRGSIDNVYTTEAGMNNYIWVVSSGGAINTGGGSNNNTATVTWNSGGSQSVSVNYKNSNGCSGASAALRTTTVSIPVIGVSLDNTTASISINNTIDLIATINPADADEKGISWGSDNPSIATVSSTGRVLGIANGTTKITVLTTDGSKTATCDVTVTTSVTGVRISLATASLQVNNELQLGASVQPADATNKNITWSSDNPTVAIVNSTGLVTAKTPGITVITASSDNNNKATCTVTVPVSASGVSLNLDNANLNTGQTLQLSATVHPETATNKTVSWWSTSPQVASVNSTGLVTALTVGAAKIIVKAADGNMTDTCLVRVAQLVTSVELTMPSTGFLKPGDNIQLIASVLPNNATDKRLNWSSDNQTVATVNNGLITAIGAGKAVISATSINNIKGSITITVYLPGMGVTLDKHNISLVIDNSIKLETLISPPNAFDTTITWKSSVPQVARVDNSGIVTGKAMGTTKIYALFDTYSKEGIKADSCEVSVYIAVARVAFETKQIDLTAGIQEKLNAFVFPLNAGNRSITMTSMNTGIVSVNNAGYIMAHNTGTTSIIVTTDEGQKRDTCTVTVHPMISPATSIETASGSEFTIYPNPFTGSDLTIKLKRPSNEVKVKILDILGRVVYQNDKLSGSEISLQPAFGHGIYVILVESANDRYLTKIFVP